MEKLDLTKILKNCPKGWKFWSPIFGEVEFEKIVESISFVNLKYVNVKKDNDIWSFYSDATFPIGNIKSDEILLYPSKYQRDWSKFTAPWYKIEKFDPKTLKPFDKVLIKTDDDIIWTAALFSHIVEIHDDVTRMDYIECVTSYCISTYCIPYNNETKHLLGTEDEAPKYYRYWDD